MLPAEVSVTEKLHERGELGLIESIRTLFAPHTPPEFTGIGDDAAVLPLAGEESLVISKDLLVEHIHFRRETSSARDLGYKSLAVNLSDLAAMGASPVAVFLGWALPARLETDWIDAFLEGFSELAREFSVPLLGGDTTGSERDIMISVTVVGRAKNDGLKFRSGARAGDLLCLTGTIGDSGAGLRGLLDHLARGPDWERLVPRHLRPSPHVNEGRWLARHEGVRAMMDLSDGLDLDLGRLIRASGRGADVDLGRLPLSEALLNYTRRLSLDPASLALFGGEDYVLMCALDPRQAEDIRRGFEERFGRSLHPIGAVSDSGELRYFSQGVRVAPVGRPFNHHSRPSPD